jgi:hypothetical protein
MEVDGLGRVLIGIGLPGSLSRSFFAIVRLTAPKVQALGRVWFFCWRILHDVVHPTDCVGMG